MMTLLSGDKGEGYNRPDYNRKQYTTEFIVRTLNTELYRSLTRGQDLKWLIKQNFSWNLILANSRTDLQCVGRF